MIDDPPSYEEIIRRADRAAHDVAQMHLSEYNGNGILFPT